MWKPAHTLTSTDDKHRPKGFSVLRRPIIQPSGLTSRLYKARALSSEVRGDMQKCKKCTDLIRRELGEYKVCSSCFKLLEDSDKRLLEVLPARSNPPTAGNQKLFLTYLEENFKLSIERLQFDIYYFSENLFWFFDHGQRGHINYFTKLYLAYPQEAENLINQLELQRVKSRPHDRQINEYIQILLKEFGIRNAYSNSNLKMDLQLLREWQLQCTFWDFELINTKHEEIAWHSREEFREFLINVFKARRDIFLASESDYLELPLDSRTIIENYARCFVEEDSYSGPLNVYVENFITCFNGLEISEYLFMKSFKENAVFVFSNQLKVAPTYVNILKLLIFERNPNVKLRMIMQPTRRSLSAKQSYSAIGVLPRPTQLGSEKEPYIPKGYVSRSWKNRWRND
jgi:hypothetical protein